MSEYQFDQSDIIIQNGSDEAIEAQAQALEQDLEEKLKNNQLSMWDMDNDNIIGNNQDHFFLVAGLGNQKVNFDNTVDYLVFGDNPKDDASDQAIEAYRTQPHTKQNVTILSGRKAGLNYTANGESGTIINTVGKLIFNGDKATFIEKNGHKQYMGKRDAYGNYTDIQNDDWTIVSGDADNAIYLGNGKETVRVGNGKNTIHSSTLNFDNLEQRYSDITAGKGDNDLYLIGNATVNAGNGNNNITLDGNEKTNQYVKVGNGDNYINAQNNTTIIAGNGNNTISAQYTNQNLEPANFHIDVGDGNNNISVRGSGDIIAGTGQDIFLMGLDSDYYEAGHINVTTKDGYKYAYFRGNLNFTAGNGKHDFIQMDPQGDFKQNIEDTIHLGDGNNTMYLTSASHTITTGDGDNTIEIHNETSSRGKITQPFYNTIKLGKGTATILQSDDRKYMTVYNDITTGEGDSTIDIDGSYNTVHAGVGYNSIHTGSSVITSIYTEFNSHNDIIVKGMQNNIASKGQDTIRGVDGQQTNITLMGGQSEIDVNHATILDASSNNHIVTHSNSTIMGGDHDRIEFNNDSENNDSTINNNHLLTNSTNDTVSTANGGNLQVIGGNNNQFTVDGNFTFADGTGQNAATVNGSTNIHGFADLNLTLNAQGQNNIFQAGYGNETLNGTQSKTALHVHADQTTDQNANLVATTGSGDDVLYAGWGRSTFTGGLGNNTFVFDGNDRMGPTVITDFSASKGNKIGLFNYYLTEDSLTTLLQNAFQDEQGNTILYIKNTTITIQGVSPANLHADQFLLDPPNTKAIA